jgi:phosphohistidine phosphatase
MRLYVMRHGPAEDQSPSGQDSDRALSIRGRQRVRAVAAALVEADETPLAVVSSQLARALQTAEIVAIGTDLASRDGSVEVRRELAPGAEVPALAREIVRQGRDRVMLVGHEPDLSSLVAALVGRFDGGFDKAMVVGLDVAAAGAARLRFVLDPKALVFRPDPRTGARSAP